MCQTEVEISTQVIKCTEMNNSLNLAKNRDMRQFAVVDSGFPVGGATL